MFYIKVQQVDYDDYPQGSPRNIGPFDSEEAAETFLEGSDKFVRRSISGFHYWTALGFGRTTVNVYSVDSLFVSPEDYAKRGY